MQKNDFIQFGESLGLNFVDGRTGQPIFTDDEPSTTKTISGKYAKAVVFTHLVEQTALDQVTELVNQPFAENSAPRFMPDIHAGKGCTVGTTLRITDKVCPNLIGVDIGCGVEVYPIKADSITNEKLLRLDKMLHFNKIVPSGFNHRDTIHEMLSNVDLTGGMNTTYNENDLTAFGSLGGGNHFIEIDKDEFGKFYLVIHSGSRSLGLKVCAHHQEIANSHNDGSYPKDLSYLTGQEMQDYLNDMRIAQEFAKWSRRAMAYEIFNYMGWEEDDGRFSSVHNYIDLDNMILRKGAISAQAGEKMIIPMNMRDGSIIALGKGNAEWNYSAPHGAGRLMSRTEAKKELSILDFQHQMSGVFTTCVDMNTIDESPMAYKPMQSIVGTIKDTADIISIIKPIYNFKAN